MPDKRDDELTFGSVKASRTAFIDFVAKYQGDAEFRAQVDLDPAAALRSEGFAVPDGTEVRLLQSTDDDLHIVLPDTTND